MRSRNSHNLLWYKSRGTIVAARGRGCAVGCDEIDRYGSATETVNRGDEHCTVIRCSRNETSLLLWLWSNAEHIAIVEHTEDCGRPKKIETFVLVIA